MLNRSSSMLWASPAPPAPISVSGLGLSLAGGGIQHRQPLVLLHELRQDPDRLLGGSAVAAHERERPAVLVIHVVVAVRDLLRVLQRQIDVAGRREHPHALADESVAE